MPDGPGLKYASMQQFDTYVYGGVLFSRVVYMSICSRYRVRLAPVRGDRYSDGVV